MVQSLGWYLNTIKLLFSISLNKIIFCEVLLELPHFDFLCMCYLIFCWCVILISCVCVTLAVDKCVTLLLYACSSLIVCRCVTSRFSVCVTESLIIYGCVTIIFFFVCISVILCDCVTYSFCIRANLIFLVCFTLNIMC